MMDRYHTTGEGLGLLTMDQYEFIRTGHRVYGKSISELSRTTGHSRNTVRKAIRGEPWNYQQRKNQAYPVLGPYLETIKKWLEADKDWPKKQRHTARRVYNRLVNECGYQGAESTVRRQVRTLRAELGMNAKGVFIPCDPEAGIEAEVDWGTAHAVLDGTRMNVKFFCMRSKYSGKHFIRAYSCERQQAFFDAHIHSFQFFGGVFPVLIYDNLTTAVRKIFAGRNRLEQESFRKFRAYHNFEGRFTNPASGHEKGGVEGLVGFARRNYMVPVPEANDLTELNDILYEQCSRYGSHKIAGRQETVEVLHEKEQGELLPMPESVFDNHQLLSARVDKYATVMVDKNRYSVPTSYAGRRVSVLQGIDTVRVSLQGRHLAEHDRVFGNNKWQLIPDHYLELLKQRPMAFNSSRPIRQWRASWPESLHRFKKRLCQAHGENKGIKEFISVLMCYRDYRNDEVETAVALALKKNISSSQGVKHLLVCSHEQPRATAALKGWQSLPTPDLTAYKRLGGLQ